MWSCPKCERVFEKASQPHSCSKIPLEKHFENKIKAKEIFDRLLKEIDEKVGKVKTISLPCCIHLFGKYDFLAALPKKEVLEVRFSLEKVLKSPRLKQSVPVSSKYFKNCIDIDSPEKIDKELITWLTESYHLKDK